MAKYRLIIQSEENGDNESLCFYDATDPDYSLDIPSGEFKERGKQIDFDGVVVLAQINEDGELCDIPGFPQNWTLKKAW